MQKNSSYRQRGYKMADGSLKLVYGEEAAPADGVLEFDHSVVEVITITDYVAPVASAAV